MMVPKHDADTYSEAETAAARRETALQRMFATPHKPHKPIGKCKPASSQSEK